ncbi:hypothetical protein BDZ89DRAFT_888124, partial [Hymenopellis radicata]
EPTVDSGQINGVLRPLVDDLLKCWTTGFWLSRTPRFPDGRRIRIALTMIISDLPAARRLAGVGSHSSTRFCTECDQPIQDRNNLDLTKYKRFNRVEHNEMAEAWRNASDTQERKRLFETHHVRWTELQRLPYWDTTTMIAIDAMHGFYLIILQHHIRDLWGMNIMLEEDPDVCSILSSSGPRPEEIVDAIHCISSNNVTEGNPRTSPVLAEVRNDIKRRVLPPYMGRTTQHPGETRWGKLTADEWKNLCIVHLPFTLVRLWGGYNNSSSGAERHRFEMLQNYLCLIDAILLGTSDAITAEVVEEYEARFREYLSGLLAMYPDTQITPYQHLMLHFGDQLRRWGPSRHWRCFAFERYNGLLQRLNTNKKFG